MKITINDLTKVFPARKKTDHEVTAVNHMNIEIPSGKLVGLLGPSGCGKSTTLFMLSGLEEPTSGSIFFGDVDVTDLAPEKRGIGLVFQNYALYPHMTVEQNIMFPLTNMKVPTEEAKQRALEAAGLVQIEELMNRKPSELSGGQQQRVAIARALVKMPNVLLLDEPLSNLDARLRLQTREEIKRIQVETGITTVFVTHDQEEAMSICDIMVVMKLGVVQQIGEPQAIYDDPANLFVANFLGTPPINIFAGTVHDGGVFIGKEKISSTNRDFKQEYRAKLLTLQDQADAKHEEYLKMKNALDEKIQGMDPEKAQKSQKKLFAQVKALETEYDNLMTRIQGMEQSIKTGVYKIFVGVRPEGFIFDENGILTLDLNHVEVMGRDKTIVANHENSTKPTVRAIIDAETVIPSGVKKLKFNLKPNKFFLFDGDTEERLR